jgi:hypothetical protein
MGAAYAIADSAADAAARVRTELNRPLHGKLS